MIIDYKTQPIYTYNPLTPPKNQDNHKTRKEKHFCEYQFLWFSAISSPKAKIREGAFNQTQLRKKRPFPFQLCRGKPMSLTLKIAIIIMNTRKILLDTK